MGLVFFNTLSRQKEPFRPITPGSVKMYTCGPTVYDFPHIGNLRTYVFEDVLRRWLKFSGYQVVQVMNLTDVDDKTIRGAKTKKMDLRAFTVQYTNAFMEDLKALHIEKAEHYPRATDHIPEMAEIIRSLLSQGIAYRGEDGSIYYNIAKFKSYGELAHINVDELKIGARVQHDEYDKEHASDFALWKAWDPEDGEVFWETELGKGRPGWHIECSAMSMKYLGPHFDIHTGGVDNIFPHHQNEIAQSEAFTGQKFVNYWLHAEHLIVDGKKMSKSLGNFYTLRDLIKKGYMPMALRYFFVANHYRTKLNFTIAAFQGAQSALERILDFLKRLKTFNGKSWSQLSERLKQSQQEFQSGMNDDLNTPQAMAAVHDLITEVNMAMAEGFVSKQDAEKIMQFFVEIDSVLGLNVEGALHQESFPAEIVALMEQREAARKAKDFAKSDILRKSLLDKGFFIEDTPSGPRCKPAQ